MTWYNMIWHEVWYYDLFWYGMIHDMIHDITWFGMRWYDIGLVVMTLQVAVLDFASIFGNNYKFVVIIVNNCLFVIDLKYTWNVSRNLHGLALTLYLTNHRRDVPWNMVESRLEPSQWETSSQCKAVSHWLGAHLESALWNIYGEWPYFRNHMIHQ